MTGMTGKQVFMRYASQCAPIRLEQGKITQEAYEVITGYIERKEDPPDDVLQVTFPDAYRELKDFAKELGKPMWSPKTVAMHWRHNHGPKHGHVGICAVSFGWVLDTVTHISPNDMAKVLSEEKIFLVRNIFGLELYPGDVVTIHQACVAEVATGASAF